jgi:rod shape-determining protein MreD
MYKLIRSGSTFSWYSLVRVSVYTFALLLVQAHWISRLPYPGLRVDLLLPLMFGVAVEWPPFVSLLWAFLWGFTLDTLSGNFWGFHVGSYVMIICMVNIAVEKLEFQNPLYQMSFVGICAFGQSIALGLFLTFESSGSVSSASIWMNLLLRSFIMTIMAPLIALPVWSSRSSVR